MKSRTAMACTVALLASIGVANAASGSRAEEYLQTADDQYRNAQQADAIANYQKAAEEFRRLGNVERFVYASNQIGVILTRQDEYERAEEYLDEALAAGLAPMGSRDLTVAATYLALGVVYSAQGQLDRSLAAHNKALEIRLARSGSMDANVATSYGNIGNVHFRKKQYDLAIDAHRHAMDIRAKVFGIDGPEIVESYRGLGNAYREKKEYALAVEYFQKALANKTAQLGVGHRDLERYSLQISEVRELAGSEAHARQ